MVRLIWVVIFDLLVGLLGCNPKKDLDVVDLGYHDSVTGDSSVKEGDSVDSDGTADTGSGKLVDTAPILGTPIVMDCGNCDGVGDRPEDLLCAVDICDTDIVTQNEIVQPLPVLSQCDTDGERMYSAMERFGDSTNDLAPRKNNSYVVLSSGIVRSQAAVTGHSDACFDASAFVQDTDSVGSTIYPLEDPFESGHSMFDVTEWTLTLTAPADAKAFSVKYVFFSAEYDEWISSDFNDKFYIKLNAPVTTGGREAVVNYTECRSPKDYFDFTGAACDTPSGTCCYIAINSSLSDCCWYPRESDYVANSKNMVACPGDPVSNNTDISGTGYSCAPDAGSERLGGASTGSSTGWLMTAWPINPGETFTITFHIHDTNDALFDSAVIIDAFQFHKEISENGKGTIPLI